MERVETTRRCNEGAKEARVGDAGGGKKRWGKGERKRRREKETTSTSFLSRLPGVRCVSSLEQRPGNLIPFSIYLNPFTQTPLPTSSTFGLFLPFSACLPSAAVTSHPYSFFSMARLLSHSSSSSERRHTFPPLLASFTNVASRIFGRVLNKAAAKGRGGRD